MNGNEINEIENIKKTLWFSFKEESVDSLNDHIRELSRSLKIAKIASYYK